MDIYMEYKRKCEEVGQLERKLGHLEYENNSLKQQLIRAEIKLGERDSNGKLKPIQNLEIRDWSKNESSLERDIKYLARKRREEEFDWDVGY